MSNKIIILDELLASKIAAGEVVERPASVVKELVENSLDAGATKIEIEIQNSGKRYIRVTDNGIGMSKDDAILSVQRHATSKIKTYEDLLNIKTLGFRGEALYSISSVSNFELITNDGTTGTKIIIDGGKIVQTSDFGCPKGTTVIVKNLFYNTPARLKFLKSDVTEQKHIYEVVSNFILSMPKVSFILIADGREILSSLGNNSLLDAIATVYGTTFAKNLLEVSDGNVYGYVSKPTDTKINRANQHFFVNNRHVKSFVLTSALELAYKNLIPQDRYPSAILNITIDPKEIDVNIHPTKREIKFSNQQKVTHLVEKAVLDALMQALPPKLVYSPEQKFESKQKFFYSQTSSLAAIELQMPHNIQQTDEKEDISFVHPAIVNEQRHDKPTILTTISNTYIVCVYKDSILIIDQHAAHERMLYEKLKEVVKEKYPIQQFYLVPEVFELNKKEAAILEKNIDNLRRLGFDVELFGSNSVRLKAVPHILTRLDLNALIKDIISQLDEEENYLKSDEALDKLAKLSACHSAVKANDTLTEEEKKSLIEHIFNFDHFSTCPHGRPTVVKLDKNTIDKLFGR